MTGVKRRKKGKSSSVRKAKRHLIVTGSNTEELRHIKGQGRSLSRRLVHELPFLLLVFPL